MKNVTATILISLAITFQIVAQYEPYEVKKQSKKSQSQVSETSTSKTNDSDEKETDPNRIPIPHSPEFGEYLLELIEQNPDSREEIITSYGLPTGNSNIYDYVSEPEPDAVYSLASESDSNALVYMYDALEGDFWNDTTGWKSAPLEEWYGVTVEGNRVVGLVLPGNGLNGSIPDTLYSLSALKMLDLSNNYLYDSPISSRIEELVQLEHLDLTNSAIAGYIPDEITNCTNLKYLSLENNYLEGGLPSALWDLPLEVFNINNCNLYGTFPTPSISSLRVLGLNGNYFDGTFPSEFSTNTKLKELHLGNNSWLNGDGIVPTAIQNFDSLEYIDFSDGNLSSVPEFIFQFENLSHLLLDYNYLSSFTSDLFTFASSSNVEYLYIGQCQMTGSVPETINDITNLQYLYAYGNYFEDLPVLTNTETYYVFSYNNLSFEDLEIQTFVTPGTGGLEVNSFRDHAPGADFYIYEGDSIDLDATIGGTYNKYQWYYSFSPSANDTLPNLRVGAPGTYNCQISNDSVSSSYGIFAQTGNFFINTITQANTSDSLTLVSLFNQGGMSETNYSSTWLIEPVELWEGVSLNDSGYVTQLELYSVQFNGPLPAEIGDLDSLNYLTIDNSGITTLPDEIGNLDTLISLYLNGNSITALPTTLSTLTSISNLGLSDNDFTSFPEALGNLNSLNNLFLTGNEIDALPTMTEFTDISNVDLSGNRLDFGDIEDYDTLNNLQYYYQKEVSPGAFQIAFNGMEYSASVSGVGGTANSYQWYLNDNIIEGATTESVTVTITETTQLRCEITNAIVTDLTLYSGEHILYIPKSFSIPGSGLLYQFEAEIYDEEQMEYHDQEGLSYSTFSLTEYQSLVEDIEMEFIDIDQINSKLYFTADLYDDVAAILSMDLTSGDVAVVYEKEFDELEGIAVDPENGFIYYTDGCCSGGVSFIKRVNYDGTNDQVVISGLDDPIHIDLDLTNQKIYWSEYYDYGPTQIKRANLNGSNIEVVATVPGFSGVFQVDGENQRLFWSEGRQRSGEGQIGFRGIGESNLYKANLDGSDTSSYDIEQFGNQFVVVPSSQTIYYLVEGDGYSEIRQINVDGTDDFPLGSLDPGIYVHSLFAFGSFQAISTNTADSVALVNIYNRLGGTAWTNKSGWLSAPVSEWYGVHLSEIEGEYRVIGLALPNNNVSGRLDQGLFANLPELVTVNLENNLLSGGMPVEFFALPDLKVIKLGNNKLTASFPSPNEGFTAPWSTLEIHDNGFYGKLPSSGSYPSLQRLRLDNNKFEGRLILPLANMSALKTLSVSHNNLSGDLPAISSLTVLDSLNASNNQFTGSIPDVSALTSLNYLNLSNNQFTGSAGTITAPQFVKLDHNMLTDISGISTEIPAVDVSSNWLDFGDIDGLPETVTYTPQSNLFARVDSLHTANQTLTITYASLDNTAGNSYQWKKANLTATGNFTFEDVEGATTNSLTLEDPDSQHEGAYRLVITNETVDADLTLQTAVFVLKITSLERDKAALLALLDSTEGFTPNNWSAGNDITAGNWEGVTLNEGKTRVTALSLPGTASRHWTGVVPEQFADMTGLKTVNLSGHEFSSFPDVTGLQSLTALNVSGNRLSFASLVPNKSLINKLSSNFVYAPQRRYGKTVSDTLDAGVDILLEIENMGEGAKYEWKFGQYLPGQLFNNETVETKGNERLLIINELNYDKQGTYRVFVTHDDIPGLTIQSRNRNIMAKTDLFGTVMKGDSPLTSGGEIFIWRKREGRAFVKEDSAQVSTSDGSYSFKDVVLGDFVVQIKPDRSADSTTLQTYYESAENYKQATLLELREKIEGIDIDILFFTPAQKVTGGARISGTLEQDYEPPITDEESSRVQDRRKVRKAACSMRRFKSQGRPEQDIETEIAYYIETDDEGYFDFTGVEPGKYRLYIEFPGVPLDTTSAVDFEISDDKENQVFDVNALIEDTGIKIEQTEVLFNWKPYVKEVNLYPNPTHGILGVDYLVYRAINDLKIQVLNISGAKVMEQKIDYHKGMHNTILDMTDFDAGMYFILFTDQKGTFKHEFKVTKK